VVLVLGSQKTNFSVAFSEERGSDDWRCVPRNRTNIFSAAGNIDRASAPTMQKILPCPEHKVVDLVRVLKLYTKLIVSI
jgi:hypothetical protein